MDNIFSSLLPWIPSTVLFFLFLFVLKFLSHFLFSKKMAYRIQNKWIRQGIFLIVIIVAVSIVVLSFPLSTETRGQIFSLIGIAFTAIIALSSTTFVGNAMAGLMLKALDDVNAGDFLIIENHQGRVTELGFLHTEIQSEDRNLITLPNLFLVSNPFTVLPADGTVVSCTVSLGYDIPRAKIEKALLKAGEEAGLQEPFVQILELGDFSVSYRIAGLLKEAKYILSFRAKLRAHALDSLHEAGIEIVSPTFMNQRVFPIDSQFIPEKFVDKNSSKKEEERLPEDMIFDLADDAESKEKIREILKNVQDKIEELNEQISKNKNEEECTKFKNRLQKLEERKQRMEKHLNELDKESAK